jgi:DEAD/DEAH box helicase domain-containing protein
MIADLTHLTGLSQADRDALEGFVRSALVTRIDAVVASHRFIQSELSARLATAGLLPMFGFPTRVRPLYSRQPRGSRDDDSAKVSDRSIDMAISSFAPGAEVLRDKSVYVACGFAAWEFRGPRAIPIDPLGQGIRVTRCPQCDATRIEEGEGEPCQACHSPTITFDLHEPKGFRTLERNIDYEDHAERGPLLSPPQLGFMPPDAPEARVGELRLQPLGGSQVVVVNDNSGQLFPLTPEANGSVAVWDPALYSLKANAPRNRLTGNERRIAIGSVKTTDVLLLSLQSTGLPGPDGVIDVRRAPAGLSAIWSFTELLRKAAGHQLDVDPSELQAGLQPTRIGSSETRRIFLADALENGAGYAARLADPAILRGVLDRMLSESRAAFQGHAHAARCNASCPDCLRSYDNRLLHSQLDWRLSLDVAEVAAEGRFDPGRWLDEAPRAAERFVAAFATVGLELRSEPAGSLVQIVAPATRASLILIHPLWMGSTVPDYWVEAQTDAAEAAVRSGVQRIEFIDLWTLERTPDRALPLLAEPFEGI